MHELDQNAFPYLIFVPKSKDKQEILFPLKNGSRVAIYNEFTINKNKTNTTDENLMIFLKQLYDPKTRSHTIGYSQQMLKKSPCQISFKPAKKDGE